MASEQGRRGSAAAAADEHGLPLLQDNGDASPSNAPPAGRLPLPWLPACICVHMLWNKSQVSLTHFVRVDDGAAPRVAMFGVHLRVSDQILRTKIRVKTMFAFAKGVVDRGQGLSRRQGQNQMLPLQQACNKAANFSAGAAGQQRSRQASLLGILSVRRASSAPLGGAPLAVLAAAVGLEAATAATLRTSAELGSPNAPDPGIHCGAGENVSCCKFR